MLEELEVVSKNEMDKLTNMESAYSYESMLKYCILNKEELLKEIEVPEIIYNLYNGTFKDSSYLERYNEYIKPVIDTKQLSTTYLKKGLSSSITNQLMVTIDEIYRTDLFDDLNDKEVLHMESILILSALISKGESLSKEDLDILLLSGLFYHLKEENKDLMSKYLYRRVKDEDIELIKQVIEYQTNKSTIKDQRVEKIAHILEDAINLDNINDKINETPNIITSLKFNVSRRLIKFSMQLNECIDTKLLKNKPLQEEPVNKNKNQNRVLSIFKKYIK